jgi:hypothetical protein
LLGCSIKETISEKIEKIVPQKNYIYLFYRKTDSKNGIIAQSYNRNNSKMSHIGIGFVDKDNNFLINHILEKNIKLSQNDIWSSSVDEFYNKREKIVGGEVWISKKPLSDIQMASIKNCIDSIKATNVRFDFDFNFNDHKNMYCSEFAYVVLNKVSEFKIDSKLSSTKLKGLKKTFLGRSTLKYLPVDFLYLNHNFEKIYSNSETD